MLHHIAGDGWSLAPLVRDLSAAYAARRARRGAGLGAAAGAVRRLRPVAAGAARRRTDPDSLIAAQLDYWRERWPALPEELALPADRPRPAVASHRGDRVPLRIAAALTGGWSSLARAEGATPVHGAAGGAGGAAVPAGRRHRHPDRDAPSPGAPTRRSTTWSGSSSTPWCCAPTSSGDPDFRELLARVRETDAGRARAPGRAVRAAGRGARPGPLAGPAPAVPGDAHPAEHRPRRRWTAARAGAAGDGADDGVGQVRPDLDLAETVDDAGRPAGLHGVVDVAADLFDRPTARALRRLAGPGAGRGAPTRTLRIGDRPARPRRARPVLAGGTTPRATGRLPRCTGCSRAGRGAPRTRPRWCLGERPLTYARAERRGRPAGRHLIGRGVGPGVGGRRLALPRAADSGRVAGGLEGRRRPTCRSTRSYPAERIAFMLGDAGSGVVLTDRRTLRLPDGRPCASCSTSRRRCGVRRRTSPTPTGRRAPRRHPAYVIYTSGSTGTPRASWSPHARS